MILQHRAQISVFGLGTSECRGNSATGVAISESEYVSYEAWRSRCKVAGSTIVNVSNFLEILNRHYACPEESDDSCLPLSNCQDLAYHVDSDSRYEDEEIGS